MIATAPPNFAHLLALSGPLGTYEHARFASARVEHGFCTDDVARVLLVLVREPLPSPALRNLTRTSLNFLRSAQSADGTFRNRRDERGVFMGASTNHDWWGRAMWALGVASVESDDEVIRREALESFSRGARVVSPWPRASAFAVLGAAAVLTTRPANPAARRVLESALRVLDRPTANPSWCWPEARLTYANAVWADALMAAGTAFKVPLLQQQGLDQLTWLVDRWTRDGHLSVVGVEGECAGEHVVGYDQQPIEIATLSEAFVRAYKLSADERWRRAHEMATAWFLGANDQVAVMFDEATGGGYDGLTAQGVNLNQGAESTLALLATWQNARHFARIPACAS